MKLYFFPGACSQAPHIVAREANIDLAIDKVDTTKPEFREINPLGLVPVLDLDDGTRLTEAAVIIQYLADQKPETQLLAPPGTRERWRQMEWLNFVATEVHKTFRPLFKGAAPEVKEYALGLLPPAFDHAAKQLGDKPYLFGERFTGVDAYFAVIFGWTRVIKYDTGRWPTLNDYVKRVRSREAVRAVLRAEGLLKE